MNGIRAARVALAALCCAAWLANAGGPLGICNSAPLKYPGAGTVSLNYDRGNLGGRTKAQADAIVTAAASKWTDVATATLSLARGSDLAIDVTSANHSTYFGKFSDGLNPVIYDSDGSIIDALMGAGSSKSVLGFAGFGIAVAGSVAKIDQFNYVTTLVITPMFLVAGTFFPIDGLPEWAQVLAQFNPLHQLVELVRHASFGFEATDLLRLAGLLGFALVMWRVAISRLSKRLID